MFILLSVFFPVFADFSLTALEFPYFSRFSGE